MIRFESAVWLPFWREIVIRGPRSAEEEMIEYTLVADPFSILTVVVAPAVLTNASSVLALGTNNRLARMADRSHAVAAQLAKLEPGAKSYEVLDAELPALQTRAQLLLRALAAFTWASDCLPVRCHCRCRDANFREPITVSNSYGTNRTTDGRTMSLILHVIASQIPAEKPLETVTPISSIAGFDSEQKLS